MSLEIQYHISNTDSPLWAFAIHDGHQLSEILKPYMLLSDKERLREEDPFTAIISELPINQFFVSTSRFQLDLNRTVQDAVYLKPEQSWGLHVFQDNFPKNYVDALNKEHDAIYYTIGRHISTTIKKYGFFVIFDIHSYNAKRDHADQIIDTDSNPQINLGTFYNHSKWRDIINEFSKTLQNQTLYGEKIDVRENVKFKGGNLAQHILQQYGELGCVISVEFRKDFMNEWTGEADNNKITACKQLLINTVQSLNNYLNNDRR